MTHQRTGAGIADLLREFDVAAFRRGHLLLDPRLTPIALRVEPCDVPRSASDQHDAVANPGRARLRGPYASAHVLQRRPGPARVS